MITLKSKKYDGLRPLSISSKKLDKYRLHNEDDRTIIKNVLNQNYHIYNPRDWMFTDESDHIIIFYPKITNAKVNRIKDDIGE